VFVMNLIGSPGSGKTAILEQTAARCEGAFAVIVGDVKTALDADRILSCEIDAIPIETGGSCHLPPAMVHEMLGRLDLEALDFLVIENVGNLVCPSNVDLGEDVKVGVLSVPEGDEKVRKYPALFTHTDAVLINKTDLLAHCPYDLERVQEDCRRVNSAMRVMALSAKTGAGFEGWFDYLRAARR
jgi:hydrogenase nickel incorporation protein HypB